MSCRIVSRLTFTRSRPASLSACACRAQPDPVGRQGHLRAGACSSVVRATMPTRPRRSSGSPPVNRISSTPSWVDGDRDEPDDLVVGEQLRLGEPVEPLLGHAVAYSAGCTGRSATPAGRWRPGRSGPRGRASVTSSVAVTRSSLRAGQSSAWRSGGWLKFEGVRRLMNVRWIAAALAVLVLAAVCVSARPLAAAPAGRAQGPQRRHPRQPGRSPGAARPRSSARSGWSATSTTGGRRSSPGAYDASKQIVMRYRNVERPARASRSSPR